MESYLAQMEQAKSSWSPEPLCIFPQPAEGQYDDAVATTFALTRISKGESLSKALGKHVVDRATGLTTEVSKLTAFANVVKNVYQQYKVIRDESPNPKAVADATAQLFKMTLC